MALAGRAGVRRTRGECPARRSRARRPAGARTRRGAAARVHSPAGLDLGPATQPEIAVAILAELVAWRHTHHIHAGGEAVLEAVDPVCGMTVAVCGG